MPTTEDLLTHPNGTASHFMYPTVPGGADAKGIPLEPVDGDRLSDMEEWHLACRIAASKRLCKSDLLPRFLLYICEQTLMGNAQTISEQRIGIHIFNRPTDYNPGEDNIVRSYARMLRKRIDEYFESEGSHEPMRMVIPRGGYVPVFATSRHSSPGEIKDPDRDSTKVAPSTPSPVHPAPHPVAESEVNESGVRSPRQLVWATGLICLLIGCFLGSFAWWAIHGRDRAATQELADPIWTELFQANRNTLIVPADSGLGILQNLTGRLISLETYANGSYFSGEKSLPGIDAGNLADLRQQRYTSVVDLNIVAELMQLPEISGGRAVIRYARSITAEDLKSSNVILLGSSHTNPWVSLFEDRMNFRLQYSSTVDRSLVLNVRPNGQEQTQYLNGSGEMANRTFGVIDYLPNLDGGGHVLIIQGLNMAATQAAADVLFYSPDMRPILDKARLPDGSLRSFELLIQTNSIGATDPGAQIIATRFYD